MPRRMTVQMSVEFINRRRAIIGARSFAYRYSISTFGFRQGWRVHRDNGRRVGSVQACKWRRGYDNVIVLCLVVIAPRRRCPHQRTSKAIDLREPLLRTLTTAQPFKDCCTATVSAIITIILQLQLCSFKWTSVRRHATSALSRLGCSNCDTLYAHLRICADLQIRVRLATGLEIIPQWRHGIFAMRLSGFLFQYAKKIWSLSDKLEAGSRSISTDFCFPYSSDDSTSKTGMV